MQHQGKRERREKAEHSSFFITRAKIICFQGKNVTRDILRRFSYFATKDAI